MAKTPEQIWASMNADQQKAFQAKNKDFSVDMLKSPVNQQNASGTFSPIAPKTTTPTPSAYNPNVFGDVSGQSTAGQNLSGIKTSTGTTYKAPTEIKYTPLNQNLNYWGTQAEQKLTGNQFAQRNDQTAMNLVSQGKTQDTDIEAFLKSQPGYTTATPEQQANTIRAVKERIGAFSQQPQAEADPFVESLKRELGLINLKGEGDISEFIRTAYGNQQTIDKGREKFSNWDETQRKVQGVIDAVARNKMMESQKGMTPTTQLTESDIQAAMQATGATREEIIAISAGKGYDALTWDETYKKENLTKDFDRWVDDSTLEKQRTMDDMTTKLNELRQSVSWQVDDIVQKVTENVQGAEKVGALKGFNRSSGYLDGLMRIKDDGNKLIDRLQTQLTQAENADEKIRGRLMEDFNRNLSRAKFDLDQQLTDLKDKTAVDLGSLQSKYSLGSPQMEVAITGLLDNIYSQKLSAISQYQQLASNAIKTKSDELDLIEKQESQWLNKIKQVETAITAGGGQVLMNMNINDIKGYVSQGMSADVARQMRDAMVNRTIASFSGLSNEDKQTVAGLIDKGSSPTEVMAFLQSQGKQMISTGDEFQNVYVDGKQQTFTKINGQRQPINLPGMGGQQEFTGTYNEQLATQFLEQYQDGMQGPRTGQCGAFVNDYLKASGLTEKNEFQDPITQKAGLSNTTTPTVGSIAIIDSITQPEYGHVEVVTSVNADGTLNLKGSNRNGDKKVYTREDVDPKTIKYGFFDPKLAQQKGGKDDQIMSSIGVPISFERRIKNMVPATLMNSEIELKQLNDVIKQMYDGGMTPEEAVLTYLGVDIPKPKDKEFASSLISTAKGLTQVQPNFYSNLSDFINKGQREQAVMYLEREAINQAQKDNPDLKFSDAGTSFAVKQGKEIQDLMKKYESQFGPIKGKRSDLTKGIFGNEEAQKLATKITQSISKMRNDLVGSQITGTEKALIKELIPSLDETAETAYIKTQNLIDTPISQYNQARSYVGLPNIDIETLLDRKKRLGLYDGTYTIQGTGQEQGTRADFDL